MPSINVKQHLQTENLFFPAQYKTKKRELGSTTNDTN